MYTWADENPELDTRSRESNSGPYDLCGTVLNFEEDQMTSPDDMMIESVENPVVSKNNTGYLTREFFR